eukprot:9504142-Pyramimonas_sp.AAC.1
MPVQTPTRDLACAHTCTTCGATYTSSNPTYHPCTTYGAESQRTLSASAPLEPTATDALHAAHTPFHMWC